MTKYFLLAYCILPISASLQPYVGNVPAATPSFLSPFHDARMKSLSRLYQDQSSAAIQKRHHLYSFLESRQERHFVITSLTAATHLLYYTDIPLDNYDRLIKRKIRDLITQTYNCSPKPPLTSFPYSLHRLDDPDHVTTYYNVFCKKISLIEKGYMELYRLQNNIFSTLIELYKNNAIEFAANPVSDSSLISRQSETQIRSVVLNFLDRLNQQERALFVNTFAPRIDEFSEKIIVDLNAIAKTNPEMFSRIQTTL